MNHISPGQTLTEAVAVFDGLGPLEPSRPGVGDVER